MEEELSINTKEECWSCGVKAAPRAANEKKATPRAANEKKATPRAAANEAANV
ncbi:hypothetical protein SLEP1_g48650 [Rubroshorea leprosula]|uniref:Uncharacterized protein n=1 Tax=Rubroshorea leprosula TaxID=152421 RepID=A0AAV5LUH1_9ROSI|nr:hypothetical protein SLEP1_g48650 [Rubroshorea leprosula]